MWLSSSINLIREKRLQKKCLEEILEAVRREGIELTKHYLTLDKVYSHGIDNRARRFLEYLKAEGIEYTIEVIVQSKKKGIIIDSEDESWRLRELYLTPPEGSFRIGETKNPYYDKEARELIELLRAIKIQEPTSLGEVFRHLNKRYKEWEETPTEIWEERYRKRNGRCPECYGWRYIPIGDFESDLKIKPCIVCNQTGKVDLSTLCLYYKPKYSKSRELNGNEIKEIIHYLEYCTAKKIAVLQHQDERLVIPTERAVVYVKIKIGKIETRQLKLDFK